MTVGDNIRRLRESHDMTQEAFGKIAEVSSMAVSQWENGRAVPRMGAVQRLADHFKVPKSAIIDDETNAFGIPGTIKAVGMQMGTAPLVGSVHAGDFSEPDEYQEATSVAIPQFLLDQDPDMFVLLTEGDCMSKAFGEGQQHLAVSPHAEAHDGSIVVVRIDDSDLLVRRLRLSINGRRLCADSYNPDYEDIVVPYDSGRIVTLAGVVKWNQSAEELE